MPLDNNEIMEIIQEDLSTIPYITDTRDTSIIGRSTSQTCLVKISLLIDISSINEGHNTTDYINDIQIPVYYHKHLHKILIAGTALFNEALSKDPNYKFIGKINGVSSQPNDRYAYISGDVLYTHTTPFKNHTLYPLTPLNGDSITWLK